MVKSSTKGSPDFGCGPNLCSGLLDDDLAAFPLVQLWEQLEWMVTNEKMMAMLHPKKS
jgi:hypothetical protein